MQASYTVKLTMDKPMTKAQSKALRCNVELLQAGAHGPEEPEGENPPEDGPGKENTYLLRLANSPAALKDLMEEISKADLGLENLQITPVTLEDVFLELTGSELRD